MRVMNPTLKEQGEYFSSLDKEMRELDSPGILNRKWLLYLHCDTLILKV